MMFFFKKSQTLFRTSTTNLLQTVCVVNCPPHLKAGVGSDLAIKTISRVDVNTGEAYVLVHGVGMGAEICPASPEMPWRPGTPR
jgi:hypothetical protein